MNAPIRADIELRGAPGESARPSEGGQELPFAGRGGGELPGKQLSEPQDPSPNGPVQDKTSNLRFAGRILDDPIAESEVKWT
jgi:hypothetical protein